MSRGEASGPPGAVPAFTAAGQARRIDGGGAAARLRPASAPGRAGNATPRERHRCRGIRRPPGPGHGPCPAASPRVALFTAISTPRGLPGCDAPRPAGRQRPDARRWLGRNLSGNRGTAAAASPFQTSPFPPGRAHPRSGSPGRLLNPRPQNGKGRAAGRSGWRQPAGSTQQPDRRPAQRRHRRHGGRQQPPDLRRTGAVAEQA